MVLFTLSLSACVAPDAAQTPSDGGSVSDLAPASPTPGFGELVVSLTFDDTYDDHYDFVRPLLDGIPATFYVNSPRFGLPGYMTESEVMELQRDGHEIGSHTLHHLHLATIAAAEQRTEMCSDRAALLALGFPVTTMAYPFGDENDSAHAVAESCPFVGARDVGGLRNSDPLAGGHGYCGTAASSLVKTDAEEIPPVAPFIIRSRASIHTLCTVDDLRDMIENAANDDKELALEKRRWLVFNFHDFCDDCSGDSDTVPKSVFRSFVTWLRDQKGAIAVRDATGQEIARRPLVVRTVAQVLAKE
ncbi:MAG TPA: polysaccharide deacetylase family protein [Polyangia bacterium]|jgi:peptidoglycan/xylan/chitin deacetylase (PgdA/CDA1 family)